MNFLNNEKNESTIKASCAVATIAPMITAHSRDGWRGRFRELGWIENRTIKIDLRWAEGRHDRSAEIATEFVRLNVNVIVTYGSEQVQIAKEATSTIPIVFATAGDPVGSGLVASLAHPGLTRPACSS